MCMTPRLMHIYIYMLFLCKTSSIFFKTHIYNQMMFVLFDRTSGKDCKTLLSEEKPRAWHKSIHTSKFHGDLPPIGKIYHRFCRKSATDFGEICHEIRRIPEIHHRFWEKQAPNLGKSVIYFGEICHRVWGNLLPTLGKSVTDFGKICDRLWGHQPPTLGKSVTDFGEINHRFLKKP